MNSFCRDFAVVMKSRGDKQMKKDMRSGIYNVDDQPDSQINHFSNK